MDALERKRALLAELVAALGAALEVARAAHRAALEGATHAEARAENDKDTRGLEQSYVARGQARRVEELEVELAEVGALAPRGFDDDAPIAVGALVTLEEDGDGEGDGARRVLFVAPHGGGVALDGGAVQVVTPRSPLGAALLGRRVGDETTLELRGRRRTLVIDAVE